MSYQPRASERISAAERVEKVYRVTPNSGRRAKDNHREKSDKRKYSQ
jgi:hypothetical protein